MDSEFERQWRLARTLENQGRPLEAKPIYETLLAADPDRLYVRLRMSVIEEGQGHYRAAREHALRCANSVRSQRPGDLAHVTRRLLAFDEPQLVFELIMGADWQAPELIRNCAMLVQHLWLIDKLDCALDLIADVEPRVLPNASLAYAKAQVFKYLGRMDEAAAEYERCIAIEPSYTLAHWSLASLRKACPPGARTQRIERALAALPGDDSTRDYMHFALFKEYDDAGDIDAAWRHLQAGAAIKRATVPYRGCDEQAGFEALQRWTPGPKGDASASDASFAPIFILGMPRTGTTLVERIVGRHDSVAQGGELNDFHTALCLATDAFLGTTVTADVVARVAAVDLDAVGRAYMARTEHRAGGKPFLTDKNPMNAAFAGFIARALPNARIVCLRRDPMDACFSNLKELFGNAAYGYSYDLEELADHYARFDALCRHWRETLPGRFLEVQYETLVTDTEPTVRALLDFCGLPFDARCLDITGNTAPVSTASSTQVRQPIHARSVGAWQRYATQLEPLRARLASHGLSD